MIIEHERVSVLDGDKTGPSVESKDVSKVDEALLDEVEADVYWCLTKLLDNIQVRAEGGGCIVWYVVRVYCLFF